MRKVVNKAQYLIYCPRNKENGEYVDLDYNLTDDIAEAIGWKTPELCKKDIATFDEPDEWEVVEKVTTIKIIKEEG